MIQILTNSQETIDDLPTFTGNATMWNQVTHHHHYQYDMKNASSTTPIRPVNVIMMLNVDFAQDFTLSKHVPICSSHRNVSVVERHILHLVTKCKARSATKPTYCSDSCSWTSTSIQPTYIISLPTHYHRSISNVHYSQFTKYSSIPKTLHSPTNTIFCQNDIPSKFSTVVLFTLFETLT